MVLDWEKRIQIIKGIVQGLLYLQEYSRFITIHRDLKVNNIWFQILEWREFSKKTSLKQTQARLLEHCKWLVNYMLKPSQTLKVVLFSQMLLNIWNAICTYSLYILSTSFTEEYKKSINKFTMYNALWVSVQWTNSMYKN